ncbi:MAG: hypothetical protein SV760_05335, partial [Halobacteria archaeon]|nr:hypothetical protein [Halobacteria archaeon]
MSGTGAGSEDGAKSMTDEEAAEVARQVKEKVVEKLSGEDADVVVTHAGERMTGKLVEEGYADDLMRDIQEIVLENLPVGLLCLGPTLFRFRR